LVAVCLLLGVAIVVQVESRKSGTNTDGLKIEEGYTRHSENSTFLANVCNLKDSNGKPLDPQPAPECKVPTTQTAPARPSILTVQFSVVPSADGHRLAEGAFTLTGTNEGLNGLLIKADFDPSKVTDVRPGVYRGDVVVLRDQLPPIPVSIEVVINSPKSLYPVGILCLLIGAMFGLAVKWFNEVGAPIAGLFRRLRRVRRLLPPSDRQLLSFDVEQELVDAAESLDAVDPAAFTSHVSRLEVDLGTIQLLARRLNNLNRTIDRARQLAARTDVSDDTKLAAGRIEYALLVFIRRERDSPWPWGNAAKLDARQKQMQSLVDVADYLDLQLDGASTGDNEPVQILLGIADAIRKKGPDALLDAELRKINGPAEHVDLAVNAGGHSALSSALGEIKASHVQPSQSVPIQEHDEGWAVTLSRVASSVPSTALVIGIVVAGFLTKLDDSTYTGSLRDGLGLWAWAFGVGVTGGTVASILGQLQGPTANTVGPVTPPSS
jgi:hypothetical protein